MAYLDNLTAEQRAALLAPSKHLISFRAFTVEFRKQYPTASLAQVQAAYQISENAKLRN